MKTLIFTLVMVLLSCVAWGEPVEPAKENTVIEESAIYTFAEPLLATTVTFETKKDKYVIDAAGFQSLTPEEAQKLCVAIDFSGGLLSDDLQAAIYEKFIPVRFKVIKEAL